MLKVGRYVKGWVYFISRTYGTIIFNVVRFGIRLQGSHKEGKYLQGRAIESLLKCLSGVCSLWFVSVENAHG